MCVSVPRVCTSARTWEMWEGGCLFPGLWSGWSWLLYSSNSSSFYIWNPFSLFLITQSGVKAMDWAVIPRFSSMHRVLHCQNWLKWSFIAFLIQKLRLTCHTSGGWGRTRKQPPQLWFLRSRNLKTRALHPCCSCQLRSFPGSSNKIITSWASLLCWAWGRALPMHSPIESWHHGWYCAHFPGGKLEAQQGQRTCPASHADLESGAKVLL